MSADPSIDRLHRESGGDEAADLRAPRERIPGARARRAMTRKILARDSGVSERYLAQLETGHGNISIILLRQVAQAMSLPLAELVRGDPRQRVEFSLLVQSLARLDSKQLAQARTLMTESFGAAMERGRRQRIALI